MKEVIANAYLQGGAILLLVALLVASIIGMFKYIVSPLYKDNKELRDKVISMNEKVATMAEASRLTNDNVVRTMAEQNATFRDLASLLRSRP